MKRKITAIVLMITMLMLSACGGDKNVSENKPSPEVTENETVDNSDKEEAEVQDEEYFVARSDERATTSTISDEIKEKASAMPKATYKKIPKWHGTTIYNKYEYGWSGSDNISMDFQESTVQEISDIGFDFVRVILDTRFFYTESHREFEAGPNFQGNSDNVNLNELKNLDDLITWCVDRGIHVCLDVHNTPGGYMIGGDEEESREPLFTPGSDEEKMFYDFWEVISKRYKDISSNALSFNLYNEPPNFVGDKQYTEFIKKALDIVFNETPDRLIFVDMLKYARKPVKGLIGEKIVQTFHLYEPYEFTHVNQDMLQDIKGRVYTPAVAMYPVLPVSCQLQPKNSYTITGNFKKNTQLVIGNGCGEIGGTVTVLADGKVIKRKKITTKYVKKAGIKVKKEDGRLIFDNFSYGDGSLAEIKVQLKKPAKKIEFRHAMPDGSYGWCELDTLYVDCDGVASYIQSIGAGDVQLPAAEIAIDTKTGRYKLKGNYVKKYSLGKSYIDGLIKKFVKFKKETGTTIMLQETGTIVYVDTKCAVRYLDDVLSLCDKYDIGWDIYSHDGAEFSYVAVEDVFRRLNGNYEQIGEDRYIETNIRDLLKKHIAVK